MITKIFRKAFVWAFRKETHSDEIERIMKSSFGTNEKDLVFIEVGCGATTPVLAKYGDQYNAKVYSIDYNEDKIKAIQEQMPEVVKNVNFLIGDSLEALQKIVQMENRVDFLFLDSAASSLHTFREFQLVEKLLGPKSFLLVDNAAIPGTSVTITAVRKGKILVPYLLASADWRVTGKPRTGDSMIVAEKMKNNDYSDPRYENPEYVDNWKRHFNAQLNTD